MAAKKIIKTSTIIMLGSLSTLGFGDVPKNVKLQTVQHNGSACPSGTVQSQISQDMKTLNLQFSNPDFDTQYGNGNLQQRDCLVDIGLQVPEGWSLGLESLKYQGHADLDEGVQATQKSQYKVANQQNQFDPMHLQGPYAQDFSYHQTIDKDKLSWTPCSVDQKTTPIQVQYETSIEIPPSIYDKEQGARTAYQVRLQLARMYSTVSRYQKDLRRDVRQRMRDYIYLARDFHQDLPAQQMHSKLKDTNQKLDGFIYKLQGSKSLMSSPRIQYTLPTLQRHQANLSKMFGKDQRRQGKIGKQHHIGHTTHQYGLKWKRCGEPKIPKLCDNKTGYKIPRAEFDALDGSAGAFLRGRNHAKIDWSRCATQVTDASVDNGGIRINFINGIPGIELTFVVHAKHARIYRVAYAKNIDGRLPTRFRSNRTYIYKCSFDGWKYKCSYSEIRH